MVLMLALGSRGDVQPLAVLAGALGRRGVSVRMVALAEYRPVVAAEAPDAGFIPVSARLEQAVPRGAPGKWAVRTPLGQLLLLERWTAGMASDVVDSVSSAVQPGETVLSGVLTRGLAAALAVTQRSPVATVVYTGQMPTLQRESHFFSPWFTGFVPYDSWGVRLNWELATAAGGQVTRLARARLGLPPLGLRSVCSDADRHPVIVAASPILVPPARDWAEGVHQTGYLAPPDRSFEPDAPLAGFLAGRPAVYVGFGSLTRFGGQDDFGVLVEAAHRSGRRVVTPAPAGMPTGRIGEQVFAVGSVPHRWLFARMAGTIHHGGSGTTHEALTAGVPSATIPFGVDQPHHARRLHQLGLGPEPLPSRRLTAVRLAALIRKLVDSPEASGYRRRAAEVAAAVRGEDGVASTVGLLDRLGYLDA